MQAADGASERSIIWMRPERPPRAPQAPLSRGLITAAAMRIADDRGLDAVTMRSIATELGSGTMSLYRHVRNKDEVLDLMIDTAIGQGPSWTDGPSGDWRADLRRLARARRTIVLRHRWVARLQNGRPRLGPNVLAELEFALAAVDGLGLSMDEMVRMIGTVNAFTQGFVQIELEEREWRRPGEGTGDEWQIIMRAYVEHLIQERTYPHFADLATEAQNFLDPDVTFEWQLERVLDGLATAIPHVRHQ